MKKLTILLAVATLSFGSMAANPIENITSKETSISSGRIVIINDTSEKVTVHTGSGETTLNPRGGRTSFSCNPGKQVKVDGNVIFKVSSSMCDTTIKLSDYI